MSDITKIKTAVILAGKYTGPAMTEAEIRDAYATLGGKDKPAPAPAPTKPKDASLGSIDALIDARINARLDGFEPATALDVGQVKALIAEASAPQLHIVEVREKGEVRRVEGAHKALSEILDELRDENHVFAYGPAGSGKTTLAEQAAAALGLPFRKTGAVLTKYELVGFVDANGNYQSTAFRDAYENGALFLGDEGDSWGAEALLAINDALANGSYTFPDSPVPVKRHKNFRCVFAGNTIGRGATAEYVGRQPLDAASRDRFVFVEVEYDHAVEDAIAQAAHKAAGGQDPALVDEYITRLRAVRSMATEKRWRVVISPRASVRGAKALARDGWTIDKALERYVLQDLSDDQRKQAGAA